MAKRRITICMIVPVIIIVTVVGIFFTVTDPTSWPEQAIELSSTDMRLAPPISTIWCESIAMSSAGDFVAYRVQHKPKIDYNALIKQTINLKLKIDNKKRRVSTHELRYFLLPGSIINIIPCATGDKARVYIWKHGFPRECFPADKNDDSSDYDGENESDDDSSDDAEVKKITESLKDNSESCSKPLESSDIPMTHADDHDLACGNKGVGLLTFNVTMADTYVIVVTNENQRSSNFIRLQILIDRTFYDYHKLQKSTSICGGPSTTSSLCNVPLTFASGERVLLWVPPMRMSSRQKHVTINTQCRPRIALFALLTALFPVLLFVLVSFVLRNDRKRFREQREDLDNEVHVVSSGRRESFVSPLLPQASTHSSANGRQLSGTSQEQACSDDTQPPPYEVLFDLPPAYSSLTISSNNKS